MKMKCAQCRQEYESETYPCSCPKCYPLAAPACSGIKVDCIKCDAPLTETGALIFSYPNSEDMVLKYHVCRKCWHGSLLRWLDESLND